MNYQNTIARKIRLHTAINELSNFGLLTQAEQRKLLREIERRHQSTPGPCKQCDGDGHLFDLSPFDGIFDCLACGGTGFESTDKENKA